MNKERNTAGRGNPSPQFPKVRMRVLCTGAPRLSSVELVRRLERRFPAWDIGFYRGKGAYNQFLAPMALAEARDSDCDFFICMCDDLDLEDERLLARLPAHNVPVVDCLIPNWQLGDFYWNCYQLTRNGILYSENPYDKSGLLQIYSSALSCCCYRRDVLDCIGTVLTVLPQTDGDGQPVFMGGNDSHLCRQLHQRNMPLYMDMDIIFEHSATISLKKTMDRIRQWGRMCLNDQFRAGVSAFGYFLPARICVDVTALGEDLPVCESYKTTSAWRGEDEKFSVPFAGDHRLPQQHIPQNGG